MRSIDREPTRGGRIAELWAIWAVTVLVMVIAAPVDFFWTYAFNDDVGWDDHAGFLLRIGAVVLALSVVLGAIVWARSRIAWWRAGLGTFLAVLPIPLAAGAAYALLLLLPALDAAIGSYASTSECVGSAGLLGLLAAATGLMASRMFATSIGRV